MQPWIVRGQLQRGGSESLPHRLEHPRSLVRHCSYLRCGQASVVVKTLQHVSGDGRCLRCGQASSWSRPCSMSVAMADAWRSRCNSKSASAGNRASHWFEFSEHRSSEASSERTAIGVSWPLSDGVGAWLDRRDDSMAGIYLSFLKFWFTPLKTSRAAQCELRCTDMAFKASTRPLPRRKSRLGSDLLFLHLKTLGAGLTSCQCAHLCASLL